jgi:hypothetical protein
LLRSKLDSMDEYGGNRERGSHDWTQTWSKPAKKYELGHKLNTTDLEIELCKG